MSQININNKFDDLDQANDEKYAEIDNRIEELKEELDKHFQFHFKKSVSAFPEEFMKGKFVKGNYCTTVEESIQVFAANISDNKAADLFEWAKDNTDVIDFNIKTGHIDVTRKGILNAVKDAQFVAIWHELSDAQTKIEDICSLIALKDMVSTSTSFDGIDYSAIDLDDYVTEMEYLNDRTGNLSFDDIRNNAKECVDEFVELASDRERD